jgi:diguanylate cyclase (GGDEF)-like protein
MAVAIPTKKHPKVDAAVDYRVMLEALPCAAAVFERRDGTVRATAANRSFLATVEAGRDAVDDPAWRKRIADVIETQRVDHADWRDGAIVEGRHYSVAIAPLSRLSAMISLIDRTNEVQTEKSLRNEMLTDSLTGLPNRLGFVERMEAQFADTDCDDYAVVLVDLARFSRVNECIGSLGGDELIMTVARRLMSALRGHDQVARTGANEFALVVKIVDGPGDALHVARRIEAVMAQPYRLSDFEMKVDCAIGCALAGEADGDAERLMRHAQIALKTAKTSKHVEFYQPSALAAARRHFIVETELRRALERDALTMAFQPLMSLKKDGESHRLRSVGTVEAPDHGGDCARRVYRRGRRIGTDHAARALGAR